MTFKLNRDCTKEVKIDFKKEFKLSDKMFEIWNGENACTEANIKEFIRLLKEEFEKYSTTPEIHKIDCEIIDKLTGDLK